MKFCESPLIVASAFVIDSIFKDPHFKFHPVRIMGYTATLLYKILYPIKYKKLSGLIAYAILSSFWIYIGILINSFSNPHKILIEIIILYFMIAPNQLISEVEKIYKLLAKGDLERARTKLSFLVTRNTYRMDKETLITTSLETLSENISDCFIAPLFYYLVGGIPLLLFYKLTETTDSMFGYKTEELREFGLSFAKADDLLNFIPARIAVFIISISSFLWGKSFTKPFIWAKKFGPLHESPNAGFPEAAFAAVLGIRFGGEFWYFEKKIKKPFIGEKEREIKPQIIEEGIQFARFLCITTIAIILTLGLVLK